MFSVYFGVCQDSSEEEVWLSCVRSSSDPRHSHASCPAGGGSAGSDQFNIVIIVDIDFALILILFIL